MSRRPCWHVTRGFCKESQILDGILVADVVIDSRIKFAGFMLKLDIEKAYDHLNWNFLFWVFEKMGFGAK